ncbi:hypothetical protein B0H13DRAFT_2343888 [Mycena leptocephala]|nr:hypothetical protein B0H13DRAFT_2343888 [Mycena leptocephala]
MAPRFTSVTTKHVVRPLAPCAVPSHTAVPAPADVIGHKSQPHAHSSSRSSSSCTHTCSPSRPYTCRSISRCLAQQSREFADANGRLRLRPRLRLFTCDSHKDSEALIRKHPSRQVVVPGSLSPLDPQEQDKKYTDFRSRLDELCTQYLRPSVVLSYQDKDELSKVYNKMTAKFPWLAHYDNYWPVSVCLQGKLHNSAMRATEKSTRKVLNIIVGTAPVRTRSSTKVGQKAQKKRPA